MGNARLDILARAHELIGAERQAEYGDALENFTAVASVWSVLLKHDVQAWQVPMLMAALKLVRASGNKSHADSWIDLAGYAALAGEVSQ